MFTSQFCLYQSINVTLCPIPFLPSVFATVLFQLRLSSLLFYFSQFLVSKFVPGRATFQTLYVQSGCRCLYEVRLYFFRKIKYLISHHLVICRSFIPIIIMVTWFSSSPVASSGIIHIFFDRPVFCFPHVWEVVFTFHLSCVLTYLQPDLQLWSLPEGPCSVCTWSCAECVQ